MFLTVQNQRCHVAGEVVNKAAGESFVPAADTSPSSSFSSPTPSILLIHGAANDCDAWDGVRQGLAALGHTALAPDLPGHGQSAGSPPTSIAAYADWLLALIDALELPRVVLAGHSMGSLIALSAAAREKQPPGQPPRHQPRIAGLALIGSSLPMPVSGALLEMTEKDPDRAFRLMTLWSHTPSFYLSGGNVGHGVWGPGKSLAILRRSRPGVVATDMRCCNDYQDGFADAETVRCPALLIVGRRDRMTPPRNAVPLAGALKNAAQVETETIDGCGHAIMVESAPATVAALHRFVTQIS